MIDIGQVNRLLDADRAMVLIAPREHTEEILERLSAMGERTHRIGVIERKAESDPPLLFTRSAPGGGR